MHIRPSTLAAFVACAVLLATLSACSRDGKSPGELAVIACQAGCLKHKEAGEDLARGPCIADAAMPEGWVCDVAHNPRAEVDNIPANQCAEFRMGRAQHFVEVDENCEAFRSR